MAKVTAFLMTIVMFLFPSWNIPEAPSVPGSKENEYTCVFVHGLGGWGEDSLIYSIVPYWGMLGGDAMRYLQARGFDCCAADVNPSASAWDRACELYAQLTGTRTDYGAEHSARFGHKRFGKDYSRHPLVREFSAEAKIHLLGHSFGGATVLQFVDLMTNGSKSEQAASPEDVSGLFTGGKKDWLYSVTMLAAPMNGTTAYDLKEIVPKEKSATFPERLVVAMCALASVPPLDGRDKQDCAAYDMTIDGAAQLNKRLRLPDSLYYFSVPCCTVTQTADGTYEALPSTEPLFVASANRLGRYTTTTPEGTVVDASWLPNDGLVNTISAVAPFGAKTTQLDRNHVRPGVWNIFPTYEGDHMSLMGGFMKNNNVRLFYVDLLTLLYSL